MRLFTAFAFQIYEPIQGEGSYLDSQYFGAADPSKFIHALDTFFYLIFFRQKGLQSGR
jgi:hypothetical protein